MAACNRPWYRNATYWQLIDDYKRARPVESRVVGEAPEGRESRIREWDDTIRLSDVTARVTAREAFDVVHVQYLDDPTPVAMFDPADYTNIIDLRVRGTSLYALRSITLIGTEYRLAVFDLVKRQRMSDRTVLKEDIGTR